MLEVRAIRKFHDNKGILVGYTIQNTANPAELMNVGKNELKDAIVQGKVKVVNMTLTSDGRLIGKAAPLPKNSRKKVFTTFFKIVEVYSNNGKLVGALVAEKHSDGTTLQVPGLPENTTIEPGHIVQNKIEAGTYLNAKIEGDKPVFTPDIKKKTLKSVRNRLIKILKSAGDLPTFTVEKSDNKNEYNIIMSTSNCLQQDKTYELIWVAWTLLEDSLKSLKIKPIQIEGSTFTVSSYTGISDVRKAVKLAFAEVTTASKKKA